jgi:hypothetical protein
MAFTSLSPEILAAQIMRDLGLSNAVVAALTGIEKTKLGYAVRRLKELENGEAQKLKTVLLRLQEIANAINPFKLNTKSVPELQFFLKTFEGMDYSKIAARVRVVFEGDGYDTE